MDFPWTLETHLKSKITIIDILTIAGFDKISETAMLFTALRVGSEADFAEGSDTI